MMMCTDTYPLLLVCTLTGQEFCALLPTKARTTNVWNIPVSQIALFSYHEFLRSLAAMRANTTFLFGKSGFVPLLSLSSPTRSFFFCANNYPE